MTPLAISEKSRDLGNLELDGFGEPLAGREVVQTTEKPMAHLDLLDMPHPRPTIDRIDLEPCVKAFRNPVLEGYFKTPWSLPPIARDNRARDFAHDAATLAGEHPVGGVGQF